MGKGLLLSKEGPRVEGRSSALGTGKGPPYDLDTQSPPKHNTKLTEGFLVMHQIIEFTRLALKLPYEFWRDEYEQQANKGEGATRKGVIALAIYAIWKKPFCTFVPCIEMLRDKNVFYFPHEFIISGASSLPIEAIVNMVIKNQSVMDMLDEKMLIMVQQYQEGIRYHLRDVASRLMSAKRFLANEPHQEQGKSSGGKASSSIAVKTQSTPAGRIARAFGSLAAATPQEAEATSAAAATEAQAGGVAACLVAKEEATSTPPSAPSGAKGTAIPSTKGK